MKTEVINTHDQISMARKHGLPPVAIIGVTGGAHNDYFAGYGVYHLTEQSDPAAAWYNHGKKVFHVISASGQTYHQRKRACLSLAEEWAAAKYGVKKWQRNRSRDSVPAPLNTLYPLRNPKS